MLALFPERCRNGDGSEVQRGRVCSVLYAYVDSIMDRATDDAEARKWAKEGAGYFEQDCPVGPYYTDSALVCGSETLDSPQEF